MQTEPATWSRRDRATFYRLDAARFRHMAAAEARAAIRDRLIVLAQDYQSVAKTIETTAIAA
jgi:hypothetical protein